MQPPPMKPTRAPTWSRRLSKRGRYTHVTKAARFRKARAWAAIPANAGNVRQPGLLGRKVRGAQGMEAGQAYFDTKGAAFTEAHWTSGEHGRPGTPGRSPGWGETLGREHSEG